MKKIFFLLTWLLISFYCCKKYERVNPLDPENPNKPEAITTTTINYSRFTIVSDNNNNGIADKGETIYLLVYLRNTGDNAAYGVKATISTLSSYISYLDPTDDVYYNGSSYGGCNNCGSNIELPSGAETYGSPYNYSTKYTVKFLVSSSIPSGTQITFNMAISDRDSKNWEDKFNMTIY